MTLPVRGPEASRVIKVPREEIILTIPDMHVGAVWRRTVRYAIRSAQVLGAQVDVAEQWALLGSRFTIRAVGTHEAIKSLIALTALADPDKTRRALAQLTHEE